MGRDESPRASSGRRRFPDSRTPAPSSGATRVFVVTAVSSDPKPETRFGLYGDVEPVKDDPKHTWKVYALDKKTGKVLWERTAYEGIPKVKRHPKSTHAASTPATDGKHRRRATSAPKVSTPTT